MKKLLILILVLTYLPSCRIIKSGARQKFDWMYPGKALLNGRTPCKLTPKPLFKN